MMRPVTSVGGVLQVGVQEQLHEKVRGVGYQTQEQKSRALGKMVKPFQSLLVGGGTPGNAAAAPAANGAVPRRAASHQPAARRSSSAARPSSSESASHKKSGASTYASASRPATAGTAAAALPEPQVPVWAATAVHAPDRPNAPSQQTPAERLAAHRTPGSGVARAAKSHKLPVRQYGKAYTSASPRQLDEAHAQVSIERHARPLVIHPKDRSESPVIKFVPIGAVVGVRTVQGLDRGQMQQQGWGPQPARLAEQEQQEERHAHREQEQAQAQAQQQRAMEQYQQQLRQSQQLQQQLEQQPSSELKMSSASGPPLSASLATPYYDSLAGAPHPYSSMFQQQQQQPQPQQAQLPSHSRTPSNGTAANPSLSVHTTDATDGTYVPVFPASRSASPGARQALSSPSPVRTHYPQPVHSAQPQPQPQAQPQQQQSHSHPPSAADSSMAVSPPSSPSHRRSAAEPQSPSQRAEEDRKRAEALHERQMKLYLSPSNRSYRNTAASPNNRRRGAGAGAGAAAHSPAASAHRATPHFTPNPMAHGDKPDSHDSVAPAPNAAPVDTTPARSVSHSSSRSSLLLEIPQTRPEDLPPLPVVHAPPKLLYPPTESDPHRALAAALRGPRLQYQSSAGGAVPIETPLSPQAVCTAGSEAAEAAAGEVTNSLAAVVAERAAQRAQLQREQKALWADKLNKLRQANAAPPVHFERNVHSPSSSPLAAPSSPPAPSKRHEEEEGKYDADPIGTTLSFEHAPAAHARTNSREQMEQLSQSQSIPTHAPNVRLGGAGHPAQQQGALYGGRISDPQIVSRAGASAAHRGPASNASNVLYSAASSASAAAAPSIVTPAVSPSSSPLLPLPATRRFVVGSTNDAKLSSVRDVVERVFGTESVSPDANSIHPDAPALRGLKPHEMWRPAEVVGVNVASGVSDQPLSAQETLAGAEARARAALASDPLAEFGVGIEGGMEELAGRFYECGWVVIVDRHGRMGSGSSARFQLADPIAHELQRGGTELATIVDRLSGQTGVRHKEGFMGMITNGLLQRGACYRHGVLFALTPFISAPVYWPTTDMQ